MPINMSHCRFRNTLEALQECRDTLDEPVHEYPSGEDREAAQLLFLLCAQLAADHLWSVNGGSKP